MRLIVLLLVGLVAAACDRQKADAPQASALEAETGKGLDRSHKGKPAPTTIFKDPEGKDFSVTQLRRFPVLLNLWATWCAPCVKELPTLGKLEEGQRGNIRWAIMAVSQDMGSQGSVNAFLKNKGIGRFAAFHDPEMKLTDALGVQIMPTTILYDAQGREVWRFVGDQDWTSNEARKLLMEAFPSR